MTQKIINLLNQPNQEFNFNINNNLYEIKLRTMKNNDLVMDFKYNSQIVFNARRCINKMPLILSNGYEGNIYFQDIYGNENPNYQNFNTRFLLIFDDEYKVY